MLQPPDPPAQLTILGEDDQGAVHRATCSAVSFTSTDKLHERLLRTLQVVDRILVESRACIQPYFVAPTVRTRPGSRRRTGKHANHGAPGPSLWVTTRAWGRVD